jgi:hypothetical protein
MKGISCEAGATVGFLRRTQLHGSLYNLNDNSNNIYTSELALRCKK